MTRSSLKEEFARLGATGPSTSCLRFVRGSRLEAGALNCAS